MTKIYYILFSFLVLTANQLSGQCIITADDYEVQVEISAIALHSEQFGSTCNAEVELEYDISISDGGPTWWNKSLYTLQGVLDCDNSDGTSYFHLPNGGGSGSVNSATYSYSNTDCGDVVLNCVVIIEANGPGLQYKDKCGSVQLASLPVTFTKVFHKEQDGTYTVHWETEIETNSAKYEVLRSRDGNNWNKIAEKKSENSPTGAAYSLPINHTSESYYKIKNVDFSGISQMSEVLFIKESKTANIKVFPNPAADRLTIVTESDELQLLTIVNMNGHVILSQQIRNSQPVDVSNLHQGTYMYRLSTENAAGTVGRFIKL